jgi:hypothetical protein
MSNETPHLQRQSHGPRIYLFLKKLFSENMLLNYQFSSTRQVNLTVRNSDAQPGEKLKKMQSL